MTSKIRLLIVDDNEDDVEVCEEALSGDLEHAWEVVNIDNGTEALNIVKDHSFDCILLDYSLPALNGIETLQLLRKENIELPVIMLTGQGSERIAAQSMKEGAQDYLTKDEISYPSIVKVILQGIERKQRELSLFQRANYDHLTGLASRALYNDRFVNAIERSERLNTGFMLVYLDLDKFKNINDEIGHKAGDHLLQQVAIRLEFCVRKSDTVARLGGDEFAIIMENIASNSHRTLNKLLEKLHSAITSEPVIFNNQPLSFNASIGAAVFPDSGAHQDALESKADKAMYLSKGNLEKKTHLCI